MRRTVTVKVHDYKFEEEVVGIDEHYKAVLDTVSTLQESWSELHAKRIEQETIQKTCKDKFGAVIYMFWQSACLNTTRLSIHWWVRNCCKSKIAYPSAMETASRKGSSRSRVRWSWGAYSCSSSRYDSKCWIWGRNLYCSKCCFRRARLDRSWKS